MKIRNERFSTKTTYFPVSTYRKDRKKKLKFKKRYLKKYLIFSLLLALAIAWLIFC